MDENWYGVDDAEEASYKLELLSAPDPAVRANTMRYTVALRYMLTGKLHDQEVPDTIFGANFGSTLDDVTIFKMLTQADGYDRIMIGFDVDDACGLPENYGFWHMDHGTPVFYDRRSPWVPAGGGRGLFFAANNERAGMFRYAPGKPLLRTPTRPERDLAPGIGRAKARLAKLVARPAVQNAVGDVYVRIASGWDGAVVVALPSHPR